MSIFLRYLLNYWYGAPWIRTKHKEVTQTGDVHVIEFSISVFIVSWKQIKDFNHTVLVFYYKTQKHSETSRAYEIPGIAECRNHLPSIWNHLTEEINAADSTWIWTVLQFLCQLMKCQSFWSINVTIPVTIYTLRLKLNNITVILSWNFYRHFNEWYFKKFLTPMSS